MDIDLVVKGGKVVTATDAFEADVGVKGERIAAIGLDLPVGPGTKVVDARGKFVMPGAIDVHVHLQLPFCGTVSADDFETGTRAAARGGVTTVIDFAIQDAEKGLLAGVEARRAEADPKVCVDYGLHGIVLRWNEATRQEMKRCVAEGIPSFKMFMIYEREGWQSDDAALFGALLESREIGATICVHAESERVMNALVARYLASKEEVGAYGHVLSRPNFIEEEAIQRAIKWTEATGGTLYVVHMSTGGGADLIRAAREKGIRAYAETCPQYLLLHDEVFKDRERGHWYATCPQIKKREDNERLWRALVQGEVPIVSTDTCTFTTKQKSMWNGDFTRIPFGLPGVETLVPAIYTHGVLSGRFSMHRMVSLLSTNPARFFGLYPRKGTIAVGSDADLAILDPKATKTVDYRELDTNCDWNPFQGMALAGFAETTLSRGEVIVEGGKFVGRRGRGKYLARAPGELL